VIGGKRFVVRAEANAESRAQAKANAEDPKEQRRGTQK
jgi:hypothetical protein